MQPVLEFDNFKFGNHMHDKKQRYVPSCGISKRQGITPFVLQGKVTSNKSCFLKNSATIKWDQGFINQG